MYGYAHNLCVGADSEGRTIYTYSGGYDTVSAGGDFLYAEGIFPYKIYAKGKGEKLAVVGVTA